MRFTNAPPVSLTTATVQLAAGTKVALATGAVVALAAGTTVGLPAGQKVGVTGDVALAAGSTVALAATTEVKLATGAEVKLAAGSAVKVSTAVTVAGATASGQGAPTFAGRTVSAASTVHLTFQVSAWTTLVPAPSSPALIELHAVTIAFVTASSRTAISFSSTPSSTGVFATFPGSMSFDFQCASLPAGRGVYASNAGSDTAHVQLNYTVRT